MVRLASFVQPCTSPRAANLTPKRFATRSALSSAIALAFSPGAGATRVAPRSALNPASSQPMVPSLSATTLLAKPAFLSDWQPMIERVRPAQFTTTSVSGSGARSCTRQASSAPGASIPPGMFMRWYSSNGRESSTTSFAPSSFNRASSCAEMRGVP